MAKRVSVKLIDDLDGSEASETVVFALDGREYEMDLTEKHAIELRDALAPFVASARAAVDSRRGRGGAAAPHTTRPSNGRDRLAAIRTWAREHGHKVADRGRISAAVIEEYDQRHSAPIAQEVRTKGRKRKLAAK